MLFICTVCKYAHSSTNVECFVDPSTRRHSYFCKEHLDNAKTTKLVHIPWVSDTIDNINEFCVTYSSLIIREEEYIAAAERASNENIDSTKK
jgi:hypothetical protein